MKFDIRDLIKVSYKRESGESRLRDIHILLMDINVLLDQFSIFLDVFW